MIIELQRRIAEVGRIRIGQQVPTGKGKNTRPEKLATFRLTSPDKTRIFNAANLYGGTPQEWEAPAGPQWEVITQTDTLNVIVPPSDMCFSQHYELWSAGGCQRRCDGHTATYQDNGMVEGECLCDPDKRECDLHTRLSVMLRDLPGLGVWRIDSQGYYAAVELQGAVDIITLAAGRGQMLPARLRLEQRMTKRPGQGTRRFAVPVLDIEVTPGQLLGGHPIGVDGTAGTLAIEPTSQPVFVDGFQPAAPAASLTPVPAQPPRPTPSIAEQAGAQVKSRRRASTPRVPKTGLAPRTAAQAKPLPAQIQEDIAAATASGIPLPDEPPTTDDTPPPLTAAMNRKMHAQFRDLNIDDRNDRLALTSFILDRPITTSKQMTIDDASTVIDTLEDWLAGKFEQRFIDASITTAADLVNEILNQAAIAEAGEPQQLSDADPQ